MADSLRKSATRYEVFCACLLAGVAVVGCGKQGGAGQKASIFDNGDEAAALAAPQFAKPIYLYITPDAYATDRQLQNLNGIDQKQTYGAAYEIREFPGCSGASNEPYSINFFGQVVGYNFDPNTVNNWMLNQHLYEVHTYSITFPNATMAAQSGGNVATYNCPVVSDSVNQYLSADDQAKGLHGGVNIPLAHRTFVAWTYENRYDTPITGKGNVAMFAGTFSYKMDTPFSGISFSGQGTGTVKLAHDPDTGAWVFLSYGLQDPQLSLQ